jgi:hypothetical protein
VPLELGRHSFDVTTRALTMQVAVADDPLSEIDEARIIVNSDTHATRRTVDIVSELLERRKAERVEASEVLGVR